MADDFDKIVEGQDFTDTDTATLMAVMHQARLSAAYYLTLLACEDIGPGEALSLTRYWMHICADLEVDDDDDAG